MKQNAIETILGAVVLIVAGFFLLFAYNTADVQQVDGYEILAFFSSIDGLKEGGDVRISGIKVGSITKVELDADTYQAKVTLSIEDHIKLPLDTAAVVASEGLLSGKVLTLEPGGDEEFMEDGDEIELTQSTPGLEKLIGQAIYSISGKDDKDSTTAEITE